MKIHALLTFCLLAFLTGCAGLTARPDKPDPAISETAEVDWDKIVQDLNDILRPRSVKGPIQNRGQAETGQMLWDLSLQLELAHDGSEGDKTRARDYLKTVAEKAKQQDRLARCKSWQWLCKRRARAAQ